jgi:hypothetical protein
MVVEVEVGAGARQELPVLLFACLLSAWRQQQR